jgi:MFS transporter, OFA family, oxalate/formate antiporter
MTIAASASDRSAELSTTRWAQLVSVIICMVMIANLQYGWTLFVNPIAKAHGWSIAAIQFAFSVFIALETWLTPIQGWIVDILGPRRGPKLMVAFGGIMVAAGWVVNSMADSLSLLYLGAIIGGSGGGAVYATSVGHAVKWFPDRRGLAVGLTAAGYGAGAALTVIPIRYVIETSGYQAAFFWFGLIQGAVVFVLAWFLRGPDPDEVNTTAPKVMQSARSYTPQEVLLSPVFWLLYIMFVMVSGSGLMATAQIAPIASDFGVANTVFLFGGTTITVALIVDNVANGGARPLFGWISDNIGREYTMAIAFSLGALDGTLGVRGVRGVDLPHLGRDLQSVPVDLHRQFWIEVRDREPEPALHRQGCVRFPHAGCQHRQGCNRRLAHGVPADHRHEFGGGGLGPVCPAADASADDGAQPV